MRRPRGFGHDQLHHLGRGLLPLGRRPNTQHSHEPVVAGSLKGLQHLPACDLLVRFGFGGTISAVAGVISVVAEIGAGRDPAPLGNPGRVTLVSSGGLSTAQFEPRAWYKSGQARACPLVFANQCTVQ